MKTKILSMLVATVLLTNSLNAGQGYMSAGYVSADIDGVSSTGVSMDFGAKFGKTLKQQIGIKYIFLGENDDLFIDTQNMGDIYYSLGYEILSSTIIAAKIGLGYQNIGSIGTGSSQTAVYVTGLSYGATLTYEISKHFDVALSYTKSNLSFEELSYTANVMDASLAYKF